MIRQKTTAFIFIFLMAFFAGCSSQENGGLHIGFSPDSTAIVFSGIDQAGLTRLRNARYPDSILNELISVLQTPSERDTSFREMPVPGHLKLTDSAIVFSPDTSFLSGRDYLVITHLNTSFADAKKIITNGVSLKLKPVQKLLSR